MEKVIEYKKHVAFSNKLSEINYWSNFKGICYLRYFLVISSFFQNFRNEDKFEGLSVIDYDDLYKIPPGNVAPFYSVILKNDANTDFRFRLLLVCPCRNYLK